MIRILTCFACAALAGPLAASLPADTGLKAGVTPASLPAQIAAPDRQAGDKGKLPPVALACALTLPGGDGVPDALRLPGLPANLPDRSQVLDALCAAVQEGPRLR